MVISSLSEELKIKANKEVNEVSSKVPEDLNHIREWLRKQPHLKARTDDLWLLNFLRGCKFNLERTKEKLEIYYTSRSSLPELYTNRDPFLPELQEILEAGILLPLTSETHTTLLVQWKNANPKKLSVVNIFKVGLMLFDIFLYENNTCIINGQHVVDDFKSFSLGFMPQLSPFFLKKMAVLLRSAYPLRIKGFHCINTPVLSKILLNMCAPLVGQKLRKRLHYYTESEFDKIHEFIPISLIPEEYGGEGPSLSTITAAWKKKVESYRDWFLDDAQFCSDETKRTFLEN